MNVGEFSEIVKKLQLSMKDNNEQIVEYEDEFDQVTDPIEKIRLKTLIIDSKLNTIMGNISVLIKYIICLDE